MGRAISKNLRWGGSVVVEPHAVDLLKFFVQREGLRVSAAFAELLSWIVYTHSTACRRVFADCLELRRPVPESRLRKELPVPRAFQAIDGLCLLATLVGAQFGGKPGWLSTDGEVNVFLLDVGGQTLAVSVSCLDGSGEMFVDEWWLLIDRSGPLMAHDRVFSQSLGKRAEAADPARLPALDASNSPSFEDSRTERRSAKRGDYRYYGLGGHSLIVYLRRHTVKRFCKACAAVRRPATAKCRTACFAAV